MFEIYLLLLTNNNIKNFIIKKDDIKIKVNVHHKIHILRKYSIIIIDPQRYSQQEKIHNDLINPINMTIFQFSTELTIKKIRNIVTSFLDNIYDISDYAYNFLVNHGFSYKYLGFIYLKRVIDGYLKKKLFNFEIKGIYFYLSKCFKKNEGTIKKAINYTIWRNTLLKSLKIPQGNAKVVSYLLKELDNKK